MIGGRDGIRIIGGTGLSRVQYQYNDVSQCTSVGLSCENISSESQVQYSQFTDNYNGLVVEGGPVVVSHTDFSGNTVYAIQNNTGMLMTAEGNYWGHPSGPTHPTNPAGEGDPVSDDVDFEPFASEPNVGGIEPNIALTPSALDVELFPGGTALEPLQVSNLGELPLSFQISEASVGIRTDVPWLDVEPASGIVVGGSSLDVEVVFDSSGLEDGDYDAALVVESNDPQDDLIVVPVSMKVNHVFLRGPAPGDTLLVGQEFRIRWDLEDPGSVQSIDIVRSVDGGVTYPHTVVVDIPPEDDYVWTVSGPMGDECMLKLIAHFVGGEEYEDISPGSFIIISDPTGIEEEHANAALSLAQNFPNPFNPKTEISFTLPRASDIDLQVYDLGGRRVCCLISSEEYSAGAHVVVWNGCDDMGNHLPSGVYLYRLRADDFSETRKMTLLK